MDTTAKSTGERTDGDPNEVLLDVRPLIEKGEEPFGTIMATVAGLDGRTFHLIAPFEPTPLEGVLSAQGFTYEVDQAGDAEWHVRFFPGGAGGAEDSGGDSGGDPSPGEPEPPSGGAGASEPVGRTEESSPQTGPEAGTDAPPTESPFTIKRRTSSGSTGSATGAATAGASTPPVGGVTQAMMAMNPTLNVPPAWLPLGFLAAAGAGLIGFGLALSVTAPTAVVSPRSDHVIATVHFAVLAFLSTAVLGALHQFGPVVGAKPLRSVTAGAVTGLLFVPGVWLIPAGFATGHSVVVQIGGVMATTAVCIAAWNLSRPLSARGKGAPITGLRLAVVYLVGTALFGVLYAFDREAAWFPLLPTRVLAHAHLGLVGWLGLAYVAVAEKLWPMFLLAHRPHAHAGEWAVRLVGAGAPVLTVGLLFEIQVVSILGALVVLGGLCFHLGSLASVIRYRRRGLELLHGFVLGSAACLVVAMVLGVVGGIFPMEIDMRLRLVAAEVFCMILWLALAVIGHAHKIVPFISWNRLRDRGITTGRDGRPLLFAHLVNLTGARVTFALASLGALAGMVGALSATAPLVRLGGLSLAGAGVVAAANLVSGPLLMIRWHRTVGAPAAVAVGGVS